jgi:hypothetical protein
MVRWPEAAFGEVSQIRMEKSARVFDAVYDPAGSESIRASI